MTLAKSKNEKKELEGIQWLEIDHNLMFPFYRDGDALLIDTKAKPELGDHCAIMLHTFKWKVFKFNGEDDNKVYGQHLGYNEEDIELNKSDIIDIFLVRSIASKVYRSSPF